ncbi:MAG: VWA domain-containing protein [Bacillota bacterium]|nr:VWA domain-containing protein [Bacillota bacterium]
MYCKYCGSELSDDAVFCSNCGKRIRNEEKSVNAEPGKPGEEPEKAVDVTVAAGAALYGGGQDSGSAGAEGDKSGDIREADSPEASDRSRDIDSAEAFEKNTGDNPTEPPSGNNHLTKIIIGIIAALALIIVIVGISVMKGDKEDDSYDAGEPQNISQEQEEDEDYDEPYIEFVTADVSDYPTVRLYYRIEDPYTSETIPDLDRKMFTLTEKVEGGKLVSREVSAANRLDKSEGLSITLTVDKSGSIDYSDMDKIKNVMNEFVRSLQYNVGDQAEIISFDNIVRQMCTYTKDVKLLSNGINNMYPEGQTAFYDALYTSVVHAAGQKGAGCVVAFTDGIDNKSFRTADEVLSKASALGVPVYIIGVGYDVDEMTLREIAEGSGGRYWFIDDLYDLSQIYASVYEKEKETYVIEYVTDKSIDKFASRTVELTVKGSGYKGICTDDFTPSAATNPTEYKHSGRYEIFAEDVSWEEANEKCIAKGGHLATVTSADELNTIIKLAEKAGYDYLWLGGYTSYDYYGNVFGHWITGEDFSYECWGPGEPSRVDLDGTEEYYIMLWNIPSMGGWNWNDQRNSTVGAGFHQGKIAYVCEWE